MDGTKRWFTLIVATFGLLGSHFFALATGPVKASATFRGLQTVYVQLETLDPQLKRELTKGGLKEDLLQLTIERRLQTAGLKVLSEEEFRKSDYKSMLYVNLEFLMPEALRKYSYTVDGEQVAKQGRIERYFYRVDVELRQMVSLLRDPDVRELATTWSAGSLGYRRLSRIQADVMDQVDKFIDAYLSANRK
jgi:hypothetical protein